MNSPVKRQTDPPPLPEPPIAPQYPPVKATELPEIVAESTAISRKVPIPPPSHPQQYRAIGLVRGIYKPSPEQMTRGILTTAEETSIDAVLLGRLISLIKNHIDLTQEHLWVVYPRTRQTNDHLHVQIVGLWEPEILDKKGEDQDQDTSTASQSDIAPEGVAPDEVAPEGVVQNGFFSIRGEAVYSSQDKQVVILKIRQSPKKETEEPKYFKIKLKGALSERPIGHFWDLKAQLQESDLVIQEANDLGMIKKKPFLRADRKRPFQSRDNRPKYSGDSRPKFGDKPTTERRPVSKPIINKPTQSNSQPQDGE